MALGRVDLEHCLDGVEEDLLISKAVDRCSPPAGEGGDVPAIIAQMATIPLASAPDAHAPYSPGVRTVSRRSRRFRMPRGGRRGRSAVRGVQYPSLMAKPFAVRSRLRQSSTNSTGPAPPDVR